MIQSPFVTIRGLIATIIGSDEKLNFYETLSPPLDYQGWEKENNLLHLSPIHRVEIKIYKYTQNWALY